jgi:hypothetical protein
MNDADNDDLSRHGVQPDRPSDGADFSAPLGLLTHGRLVFASGAHQVNLTASRMRDALYRARFSRPAPRVRLSDNTVTIQYQRPQSLDRPVDMDQPFAEIRLNGSIPWEIEFRDGVARLKADLGRLQLRSLDLLGGASHIELELPKPAGTTFIYISGGLIQAAIRRPAGVAMRIQLAGAVRDLVFDGQHLGAVGGETSLETPGFFSAASRYDIFITGRASDVTIRSD